MWEASFRGLCDAFDLRIGVGDGESAGAERFLEIIQHANNWRCFAESFGWTKAPDEDDEPGV